MDTSINFIRQTIRKAMGGGGMGWGGWVDKHTHARLIQGKIAKEIMDMLTKKFMQLKNFPIPAITFLINGPPLIKATISAGLHVTTSW